MLHNVVSTGLENVDFILENSNNISQKISNIFFKIISVRNVNHSKFRGYSVFPAVNSGKPSKTTVGREFTAVERSELEYKGVGWSLRTIQVQLWVEFGRSSLRIMTPNSLSYL